MYICCVNLNFHINKMMCSLRNLVLTLFAFLITISLCKATIIRGKVRNDVGEAIAFANIVVANGAAGATTDSNGRFVLDMHLTGSVSLRASYVGYMPLVKSLLINNSQDTVSVNFTLTSDGSNMLNGIVVTGTRSAHRRLSSPVAVNVIDSKTFSITQSNTVSEGLCFTSGLRMETDCQTCNYSQLRMNGLGGAYSQILINSRPIFSSLMSLYGLEQIPANMIDRVEVVKGGGSVLYGSSAIAGTVNIITKRPKKSSFTISDNVNIIENGPTDNFLNGNATVVNEQANAGVSFFASNRSRNAYDANDDGYSELPKLTNNSFGFNSFIDFDARNKIEINGWSINEERRGGNKLEEQADKADQSEYRLHNILLGGINYEHTSRNEKGIMAIYLAGQNTKRKHYTGIDHIDAWGCTKNYSLQGGLQYNYKIDHFFLGDNIITAGIENQYEYTYDEIKAYQYLIDQKVNLFGAFAQSEWNVTPKVTLLSGLRLNKSNRINKWIFTPRLNALYKLNSKTQIRATYASGFKAPQALETDMHIAFAGGGVSIIKVDPNLIEETSNSFNISVDYNKASETMIYGFTLDGFYTKLNNSFVLEEIGTDANGNQMLMRRNGGSSFVRGITVEGRFNYNQVFQLETGFTFQKSTFDRPVAWSADVSGTTNFLRVPDIYGYYTLNIFPQKRYNIIFSGVITGPMQVPHFGGAPGVPKDVVNTTQTYVNNNLKISYRFTLKQIGQDLELSAGVKNYLNQYQKDFDTEKFRDSNYIYGPLTPRSYFMGLKFGLM